MDSLIFELQIIFYFQLFLSANVRHSPLVVVNYITPRYKPAIIPAVDYYLAHISRVSVWFQSKERPR